MKTILEFDPVTEQEELYLAQNGWKYKCVIEDIFQYLRQQYKSDKVSVDIDEMRKYIADSLNERSVEV